MIKVMIVDDEAPAREELKYQLGKDEDLQIVGEASDGSEALELIPELKPQVVFLDVQMPELDGFGLAELLMKQHNPPLIVFATAYDEYAVRAFEHAALDYLLKPIRPDRLQQTLSRIKTLLAAPQDPQWKNELEEFLGRFKSPGQIERLPVFEDEKVILLEPEEIIYVESQGRGTRIVINGKTYISNFSLIELEEKLKKHFFLRTHKSYLVNLNEIREVITWFNNTLLLRFKSCSHEVPVSRTYIKDFKQRIHI